MALWTHIWHDGLTAGLMDSLAKGMTDSQWTRRWPDGLTDGLADSQTDLWTRKGHDGLTVDSHMT